MHRTRSKGLSKRERPSFFVLQRKQSVCASEILTEDEHTSRVFSEKYFLHSKKLPTFAPQNRNVSAKSLFHGVMVSTRVFGSLSPRSNRSGTTPFPRVLRPSTFTLRGTHFLYIPTKRSPKSDASPGIAFLFVYNQTRCVAAGRDGGVRKFC